MCKPPIPHPVHVLTYDAGVSHCSGPLTRAQQGWHEPTVGGGMARQARHPSGVPHGYDAGPPPAGWPHGNWSGEMTAYQRAQWLHVQPPGPQQRPPDWWDQRLHGWWAPRPPDYHRSPLFLTGEPTSADDPKRVHFDWAVQQYIDQRDTAERAAAAAEFEAVLLRSQVATYRERLDAAQPPADVASQQQRDAAQQQTEQLAKDLADLHERHTSLKRQFARREHVYVAALSVMYDLDVTLDHALSAGDWLLNRLATSPLGPVPFEDQGAAARDPVRRTRPRFVAWAAGKGVQVDRWLTSGEHYPADIVPRLSPGLHSLITPPAPRDRKKM